MYFLIFLIIGVLFGFLTMKMARKRNRDPINGFIFGFFFPAVAMVYYWLIGNSEIKIKAEGSMCSVEEPNKKKKYEDVLHKNLHPAVFIILILFSLILIAVIYFGLIRPNIQKSKGPVVGPGPTIETPPASASEEKLPIEKPWEEIVSTDYNFRILFPSNPTQTTRNTDWLKEVTYSVIHDDIYYDVTIMIESDDVDPTDPKDIVDGMIAFNEGVELVSLEPKEFQGYEAIDFITKDNQSYMNARIISVGRTSYLLMVSYAQKDSDKTEYNKFINSFQLVK